MFHISKASLASLLTACTVLVASNSPARAQAQIPMSGVGINGGVSTFDPGSNREINFRFPGLILQPATGASQATVGVNIPTLNDEKGKLILLRRLGTFRALGFKYTVRPAGFDPNTGRPLRGPNVNPGLRVLVRTVDGVIHSAIVTDSDTRSIGAVTRQGNTYIVKLASSDFSPGVFATAVDQIVVKYSGESTFTYDAMMKIVGTRSTLEQFGLRTAPDPTFAIAN